MRIQFHVPGTPQGKGRARSFVTQRGKIGHYTPDRTRTYEGLIRTQAMVAMAGKPMAEGPIELRLTIVMPIPDSWPAWKRTLAEASQLVPTTKPDSDNVEKAIKDALNGVVWRDDAQVVSTHKQKLYEIRGVPEAFSLPVGVSVEVSALPLHPAQLKRKPEECHVEPV